MIKFKDEYYFNKMTFTQKSILRLFLDKISERKYTRRSKNFKKNLST